ncbi:MAG: hypothetical protein WD691_08835 [Acidimicrobiales bacterium]
MTVSEERAAVLSDGPSLEEREERLASGADELEAERQHPVIGHPHFLLTVAGTLMTVGLSLMLLGWFGAARSTLMEEQIPYLISGGLLGLALSLIGALSLLAHWVTALLQDGRDMEAARRDDHAELIAVLGTIAAAMEQREVTANGRARGKQAVRPVRRTPRSS